MEDKNMNELDAHLAEERARVCKLIEDTLFDMSEKTRGYVSMPVTSWKHWQEIKDGIS